MYIILDPDDDHLPGPHFNPLFRSIASCKKAIKADLSTVEGEDLDTGELITRGDEARWKLEDYKVFKIERVSI